MKLLVIPDLHENLGFLKYILAVEDTAEFDKVICLGDYFDPHGEVNPDADNLKQMAGTLVGMKEILGDKLHLICGNHDLPYYALRPACLRKRGRPNQIIGSWLPQTTLERAEIINAIWDAEFWRGLEVAVLLDGWLFSHAGVHPDWWPSELPDRGARYRWLRQQWKKAMRNIYKESENPIFAAGRARGGLLPYGGPIWLDWNQEFEDALELPQIVGHTRCPSPHEKGKSFCIDFAQAAYAVVEHGEVQLRIWPESWLGASLLDSV
ncbi:metallophosphoesterase [Coraliomargarita parva]|uniref:metallophosphoesterase n=1 Tax=Coraliomargarita parva TaxID=3014050 RepID=UPI0022B40A17|nr:metallophosphoesterase [Coraliomargarita parva]